MYWGSIKNELKKDFRDLAESKEKQELLRIKRLKRIYEYLEKRQERKMLNQLFVVGEKYKYNYNGNIYEWSGRRMRLLKKDGTYAKQGHMWINMYAYNKFVKEQ